MNGIDCSVWAPRESNVPDFHRVMSLFDIYSGITGLMLKGEYAVGIYPSQKCLSRLLEGFQYLSLCVF